MLGSPEDHLGIATIPEFEHLNATVIKIQNISVRSSSKFKFQKIVRIQ
jgi:hypothetical protein